VRTRKKPALSLIADYLAHLVELEAVARGMRLGAWKYSVPAASRPVVAEVKEAAETPRWLERLGCTAHGAGIIALLWAVAGRPKRAM